MSGSRIVLSRRAQRHVAAILTYIAGRASQRTADDYVSAILDHLEVFKDLPEAGAPRPELGPGIRSTAHKRRVTILYRTHGREVRVLSVLYGGRDLRLDH